MECREILEVLNRMADVSYACGWDSEERIALPQKPAAETVLSIVRRLTLSMDCQHHRIVFSMDVRSGPLKRAAGHVRRQGLQERIELRLSDGLDALKAGEAISLFDRIIPIPSLFQEIPQPLAAARVAQLAQRLPLDLADPLPGHVKLAPALLTTTRALNSAPMRPGGSANR